MAIAVASLILAFLLSYLLTPLTRRIAIRYEFVDRPDAHRKMQDSAVALGGGAVLLAATLTVVSVIAIWWGWDLWLITRHPLSVVGLLGAALLLVTVGLVDDAIGMRGSYKLLWQVVAASLVMGAGLNVPAIGFLGITIHLGVLGHLFTIAWLLGAINSFNLIDGVDGLAGSVGFVFSMTFGLIALFMGDSLDALIAFSLAGALLGFLRFNFPPATIYLGDAGSMLIGLALGTIALRCTVKQSAALAFAAPLAIWSIPMFDAMAAIIRRKLTGRSIYATDRGHIHHVLLTRGMKASQAVALITCLCALTSAGALISLYYRQEWIGVCVVLAIISLLVVTRVFGHVEFLLVNTRLFGFGRLFSTFTGKRDTGIRKTSLSIQGTGKWEQLWGAMIEMADRFQIVNMQLNLSLPRQHEEFFATWSRAGRHNRELLWTVQVPLLVDQTPVGRLNASGQQKDASATTEMNEFLDFVESFESQLTALVREGQSSPEAIIDETASAYEPARLSESTLASNGISVARN